jgi:hypothetical protein
MFLHQAIFQEMIYTNPFNFNLVLCIAYDSNNKTSYVSFYLSKLAWSSNVSCVVHPHEAAKIQQPTSHQPLWIGFNHDTKKLQP